MATVLDYGVRHGKSSTVLRKSHMEFMREDDWMDPYSRYIEKLQRDDNSFYESFIKPFVEEATIDVKTESVGRTLKVREWRWVNFVDPTGGLTEAGWDFVVKVASNHVVVRGQDEVTARNAFELIADAIRRYAIAISGAQEGEHGAGFFGARERPERPERPRAKGAGRRRRRRRVKGKGTFSP